jgi:hypothetical protein
MNKILTKTELEAIRKEIDSISTKLDWLDPNVPEEYNQIDSGLLRLTELEDILLASIKNFRIKKSGLIIVK